MLGNVADSFACGILDAGKKRASVAVRLGNRASLCGARSVGWAASIRTMLESVLSVLAVACAPQVAGSAAITVAVMEADAMPFRAAKAVDQREVWGSRRQALHDRMSKIDATDPWGDNVTETSLGVGVDTLCKTV
jgi:hypothetical protein